MCVKMARKARLSYDDVKDCIKSICKENMSQEKVLIQLSDLQATLKIEKDIEVTGYCIRNWGFRPRAYFEKKYPDAVTFNDQSNNKKRGLVVNPEKFIKEVES